MSGSAESGDDSSPVPFLAALAVIVLVVVGIAIFSLVGGDGLTEEQRVVRAAVAQNDALQRENYTDFRGHTCAAEQGSEAEVLVRQRASTTARGPRYVDDVTGVSISGERATGTVVYHFEKTPDALINARVTFTREDGTWKVCSPGPG